MRRRTLPSRTLTFKPRVESGRFDEPLFKLLLPGG